MFKRNVLAIFMSVSVLCVTQAAMADINGGGSTLPLPLYQTSGVLPTGFAPYIGVESGNGKAAFLNNDYTKFVAGVTDKNVHWAASDSKLTQAELSNYVMVHGEAWGPLIQLPAAATTIAIPFNKAGSSALNLTVNNVCGIFSGRIRAWEQIVGSGRTGEITVVYPKGASGTSELFTRFLHAKCNPILENGTFAVTEIFEASFSGGLPAGAVYPGQQQWSNDSSNSYPNTSEGIMRTMNAYEGRITYMSPAYAASTLAGLEDATKVATVNGVSPAPANISEAINLVPVPAIANRARPEAWVPVFAAFTDVNDRSVVAYPTSGYPILGFTNLIFSQCYADATQNTQVRAFFNRHYRNVINNDTAITNNRFVPLPAAWKTAVRETFFTASNGLSIGNTSVCNAIGRPL